MTTTKTIKAVADDRVRVSGDVTLSELYDALPGIELCVEPVCASQKLAAFLAEGGVGYGSQGYGTFGGQLLEVRSAYGGLGFTYGTGAAPLYNAGYCLQRMMEGTATGSQNDLLQRRFADADEMVLRARSRKGRSLAYTSAETPVLPKEHSGDAVNFFVNGVAGKAMGFSGAGVVKAAPADGAGDQGWAKRFVLDGIPSGQEKVLVLTQPSGAKGLFDLHKQKCADGLFLALTVHVGVLVAATAPAAVAQELAQKAAGLPLSWRIGA
jgi:hypothetical protein